MSGDRTIRILAVDDHPLLLAGLAATIGTQRDMLLVAQAGDGQAAIEAFRSHRPDVALMDLRLPVMSGLEAIRAIRAEFPDARVIVLTSHEGDESVFQAMHAGARGYLLKDQLRRELIDAIRVVAGGGRYMAPPAAAKLAESVSMPALSDREMDVMRLLARGMNNKEIAYQLALSDGTVRIHVSNILAKLGVEDRVQAVLAALRRGLVQLG
jgi:two-component system, NarL family, response regulator